ncbi:hypothetical protein BU26DRAFT_510300 [Trematosphaeria pertusa]|uniref:Uncharacterized protein n=1 Tax=Trematosphaeria pertusa TaxID=390896 RepID=A0A6A6I0L0_9PLEO|nr:uncharacterized protein BU26DRAFT_510300 [Trematosphaeria pertusa]KAF2243110.1 hypothetical protein BU26DRAFT_510300 [Trematosphaeria pertusa]
MTLSQTRAWAAIATLLLPRGMPAIVCPPWQQRCRAMRRRTGRLVMRRLPMPKDEGRMLLSAQAAEDERGRRCGGDAVICHPPVTSHRSLEPGTKRKVFISAQCPTIVAVLADETVGSGLSIRWWGLEMQRALGIAPHRPALSSKDSPFAELPGAPAETGRLDVRIQPPYRSTPTAHGQTQASVISALSVEARGTFFLLAPARIRVPNG